MGALPAVVGGWGSEGKVATYMTGVEVLFTP